MKHSRRLCMLALAFSSLPALAADLEKVCNDALVVTHITELDSYLAGLDKPRYEGPVEAPTLAKLAWNENWGKAYRAASREPFPGGNVSHELLTRFLQGGVALRALDRIAELSSLRENLPKFVAAMQAKLAKDGAASFLPIDPSGAMYVVLPAGKNGIQINTGRWRVIVTPDVQETEASYRIELYGPFEDFGRRQPGMVSNLTYQTLTSYEWLASVGAQVPNFSAETRMEQRFPFGPNLNTGVSITGLRILATVVDRQFNEGRNGAALMSIERAADGIRIAAIAEYFRRIDLPGLVRRAADSVAAGKADQDYSDLEGRVVKASELRAELRKRLEVSRLRLPELPKSGQWLVTRLSRRFLHVFPLDAIAQGQASVLIIPLNSPQQGSVYSFDAQMRMDRLPWNESYADFVEFSDFMYWHKELFPKSQR